MSLALFNSFGRPDDANKLAIKSRQWFDGVVDSVSKPNRIGFDSAYYDPSMGRLGIVQSNEVVSVIGQHRSLFGTGKSKYLVIRNSFVSLSCVMCSQNVMSHLPKSLNHSQRKIFISV
jgi:hypothetical protein